MHPKIFNKSGGEFLHFDENGQSRDKYIHSILLDVSPLLNRSLVSYVVAERLPDNEQPVFFGKESYRPTYAHTKAFLKLSENFEFFNEQTVSMVSFSVSDYLTKAGTNVTYPEIVAEPDLHFDFGEVSDTIPNQRISPSKAYMRLSIMDGPDGEGFYPDKLAVSFVGNGVKFNYDVSWDLFFKIVTSPNPRMIYGIDFILDEELKRLDIVNPNTNAFEQDSDT